MPTSQQKRELYVMQDEKPNSTSTETEDDGCEASLRWTAEGGCRYTSPPPPSPTAETSPASQDNLLLASDPTLTEDLALALLKRAELPSAVLEQLAKNVNVLNLRKVKLALVGHPHTPHYVSVPLLRQFYTFDLMRVALSPTIPGDVKIVAEDVLVARLRTVTLGERLTLARRASGRIAAALLLDSEARVAQTALQNGRLTEGLVIQAVLRPQANALLIQAVAQHAKWSFRRELRIALLRTGFLPLERALEFGCALPPPLLREVLANTRLPAPIQDHLLREIRRKSTA
jgi:hypothetical protein